ncbi:hypothetical protein BFG57_17005 [Bacillus solimangrovi]|uniref:DUF4230 domain-containing protein n=2 Tax=Bacillus solimangrovi TaxID=1305675 RepID=A0A1E5LDA2_9BACI|nr:hypothetical protein BFG57_17005 [Bacillus solimangrovi]
MKRAKQETAATYVEPRASRSGELLGVFLKTWGKWLFLLTLFVIISGAGVFWYMTQSSATNETGSYVTEVRELSKLATAEAFVKTVIEHEDNQLFGKDINVNVPGTKRKVLLIIPGNILAGVDLQQVSENDINIDEEKKTMHITLPHAQLLQEPSLDVDEVKLFSVEGVFRGDVDWEEGFEFAAEAKQQMIEEATEMGLFTRAEEQAEKVLQQFFAKLGYEVEVMYE